MDVKHNTLFKRPKLPEKTAIKQNTIFKKKGTKPTSCLIKNKISQAKARNTIYTTKRKLSTDRRESNAIRKSESYVAYRSYNVKKPNKTT
jgi:hypothetical protein